jgi:hypothetical protein
MKGAPRHSSTPTPIVKLALALEGALAPAHERVGNASRLPPTSPPLTADVEKAIRFLAFSTYAFTAARSRTAHADEASPTG